MNPVKAAILGTTLFGLSTMAAAAPVSIETNMKSYGGPGAYLSYYVTDANGKYLGSLWMSGGKSKYYKHLSGWYRATGGNISEVNGITGASVGSGKSLKLKLNLSDEIFDKGYSLHVDSSVEDYGDKPSDVVIPLSSSQSGKAVHGKGFIESVTFRR